MHRLLGNSVDPITVRPVVLVLLLLEQRRRCDGETKCCEERLRFNLKRAGALVDLSTEEIDQMKEMLMRLVRDDEGQDLIEYVLIGSVVSSARSPGRRPLALASTIGTRE
jgi:hypothetical protein